MLFALSRTDFAGARITGALYLDRRVRVHALIKERLRFDARYFVPCPAARDIVTLYAALGGWLEIAGALRATPSLWVLAEDEFERVRPGVTGLRAWGAPSMTVELRVAREAVRGPIGLAAGPRPVGAPTWEALRRMLPPGAPGLAPAPAAAASVVDLLAHLERDGIVARHEAPLVVAEDPALLRLWQCVAPAYDCQATSTTIDDVAVASGRSSRQARRDLKRLVREFDLFGGDFRKVTHLLRLRTAVLLLSAPTATVTDVAARVGYSGTVAMARAFRDARLPAPSELRGLVAYRDEAGEPRAPSEPGAAARWPAVYDR